MTAKNILFDNRDTNRFNTVRTKAWVENPEDIGKFTDSQSILKAAGLDFEVKKYNNTRAIPDGPTTLSPDKFFTYRSDNHTVLGEGIGNRYNIVQNKIAFQFFDTLIKGSEIFYETAGSINNGAEIFITAKLPDYIRIGGDDVCEKYVFLRNSHNGKGSVVVGLTPVRIWCNNMLNSVIKNCTNKVTIRHTDSAIDRLEKAKEFLFKADKFSEHFSELMNQWAKTPVTDGQVRRLVEMAMASQETLDILKTGDREKLPSQFVHAVTDVLEYNDLHASQKLLTTRGTLYGVYNAVTGYHQNVKGYKDWEHRYTSLTDGTAFLKTQASFDLCQQFYTIGDVALM